MNIKLNNFDIYYEKYGKGEKTILILPGWGDTRPTFKNMIATLEKENTIYILDYPGFGNSKFQDKDLTIYDYAKLVKDFIYAIKIEKPVIIAHSFGARIAILLATKEKVDIRKLIILDGAGIKHKKTWIQKLRQRTYKLLKKLGRIIPKKWRAAYLQKLIQWFGSSDYKALNSNMRKTFSNVVNEDLFSYLSKIKIETLLIWGENDFDTPVQDGKLMNQKIKDSGLIIIPQGGHFSYLDAPYYIYKIIQEFIK